MHWHLKVGNVVCRNIRTSDVHTWERYDPQNSRQRALVSCELKHDHPCKGSWSR